MSDSRISLDWTKVHDVCPIEKKISEFMPSLIAARQSLLEGRCPGSDFLGWVTASKSHLEKLQPQLSDWMQTITAHSDVVVVIGAGGSMLGAKAISELLTHSYSLLPHVSGGKQPLLLWAGYHFSTDDTTELLDALDGMSPSLLVISKTGSTSESLLSFRILHKYLEQRFGATESQLRIFTITDEHNGALRQMSQKMNYPSFVFPSDFGGRFSVFSAVGMVPLALAGIDVTQIMAGAQDAAQEFTSARNDSWESNLALCYATIRNVLYGEGFKVEALCHWSTKQKSLAEWWKQLFGESDAKGNTGLFPASAQFSGDLHSLGQYFQEGERHLIATHIRITNESSVNRGMVKRKIAIPHLDFDDGMGFLVGRTLDQIQSDAFMGTTLAHADGKVPTLAWEIPEWTPYWIGYWMYTNMLACAVGGLARGINPFDQPGVESYKRNMFSIMGKPGFQDPTIKARIERGARLKSTGLRDQQ